jgi:hypothetical protein
MDSRDLWEDHVNGLAKQCRDLALSVEQLESRMEYFENVLLTLLVGLKEAKIIQSDPDGPHSFGKS